MMTVEIYDSMSRETWAEICDFCKEEGITLHEVEENIYTTSEEEANQLAEQFPYADMAIDYLQLEDVCPGECDVVETTCNRTGYPCMVDKAIIGFDDFDEAEQLAKKWGLSVMHFRRTDGQQYWYRTGSIATAAYVTHAEDYGMNFEEFSPRDAATFYENEIRPDLQMLESMDELHRFLARKEEILDEIEACPEGKIVLVKDGEYYGKVDEVTMRWHDDDVTEYAIGLCVED